MQATSTPVALITGATGFIGGHVATGFIKEGWRIKLLVRNSAKLHPDLRKNADIIIGDLADAPALDRAVENVSAIIHCAANVNTWDHWDNYRASNITGVENLLQAVLRAKSPAPRFIHISTADVYGFPCQPCDEAAPVVKTGFGYGDSKAEGEKIVRQLCSAHVIPYTIFRPCNVIGPHSQFIERIGDALQSGPMLSIDSGRANAGLIYIDNLVNYILWAVNTEIAVGECYNLRDSYDVSWADFMNAFRKSLPKRSWILNMKFGVADLLARISEMAYRLFLPSHEPLLHRLLVRIFGRTCGHNAGKIHQASGLDSQVNFKDAMDRSTAWYLGERN